jgi:hypothetical protein
MEGVKKIRKRSEKNCQIGYGEEPGPSYQHPMNKGSAEERNISHPLDLSVKDQQPLDPEVCQRDLNLVCTGKCTFQSPKVSN